MKYTFTYSEASQKSIIFTLRHHNTDTGENHEAFSMLEALLQQKTSSY